LLFPALNVQKLELFHLQGALPPVPFFPFPFPTDFLRAKAATAFSAS